MSRATFTLEAGRRILRDGEPFAQVAGSGQHYSPTEIDELARWIVLMLNADELTDRHLSGVGHAVVAQRP